jgi:4-phytase/acid phosphatase
MKRLIAIFLVAIAWLGALPAGAAPLVLERVVLVQRHGVRPPVVSNAEIAKYAAQPWPAWPVPPGELTAHGGEVVRLMGETLRQTYRHAGLIAASGCPGGSELQVWADGTDQRTRRSGEILAGALAPGCEVKVGWAPPAPRDPIFGGLPQTECKIDADQARAALLAQAGSSGLDTPATDQALARLQSILAPDACSGGKGTCFPTKDEIATGGYAGVQINGPLAMTSSLAEDLLLEYAEGMPAADVGWGRASTATDIEAVMPLHERTFSLMLGTPYVAGRLGAPMARLILAALDGAPASSASGPRLGPQAKVIALAGHDSNLSFMRAVFGLSWTLAGQPDHTAPATTLAFELWRDPTSGARYVRPVIYYETLPQMRTLTPGQAERVPLSFDGCASGPDGGCPLEEVKRRVEALLPPGCGVLASAPLAAERPKP